MAIEAASRDDVQFVLGGAGMKKMIKRTADGDPMLPANVTYPPSMIATAIESLSPTIARDRHGLSSSACSWIPLFLPQQRVAAVCSTLGRVVKEHIWTRVA